jgi:hypothetical protein
MCGAVYNAAIPDFIVSTPLNTVNRAPRLAFILCLWILTWIFGGVAHATDWTGPEQQLARKVLAVTGPGAVALSIENRSSLGHREYEIIQNGLRNELAALGLHFVKADQAAATLTITLSENTNSYVWVAQIRQGAGESSVVMVSPPRPQGSIATRDSVPMTLRKTELWTQESAILDVAVLEENGTTPTHIAVLDAESVSIYRWQGGKWQLDQPLPVTHIRPWPRDLRGRLIPARDHLFDVYLPGRLCQSTAAAPLSLSCRESDDPWPLLAATLNGGAMSSFPSAGIGSGATTLVPQVRAFYAPSRNFFTGALTPAVGKFTTVAKFYSAAVLPRDKYALWLFAGVDGQAHMVDGVSDQSARLGWGSDVATVRTACGAGWQVLASSSSDVADSVRAYEIPDRDPLAVTAAIDFPGPVTALWTEARGDTAIAVARNRDTGAYEAFRLAMVCNQ